MPQVKISSFSKEDFPVLPLSVFLPMAEDMSIVFGGLGVAEGLQQNSAHVLHCRLLS
jgi:hypothetical protein